MTQRSMQEAADSAVMAAAISTVSASNADYNEAAAVGTKYGYTNGTGNVTVATVRAQTCPAPNSAYSDCYKTTITKNVQINLLRMVGFQGDVAMGTARGKHITAVAMARPAGNLDNYCFVGLGTGTTLTVNGGGGNMDWNGCSVFGNGNLRCNGAHSDKNMVAGVSHGTSGCGTTQTSNAPLLTDPYLYLAASIPPDTCGSHSAQTLTGNIVATSVNKCGPTTLTTDVTFTSANTILTINNGGLNLNGHTLSTGPGASLTIMFTGTPLNGTNNAGTITGSGSVNYAAPNTGALSGIAWIQDQRMGAVNTTFSGNNPTFNITGLVYMPNDDVTLSGNIHFQVGGYDCFALVAKSFSSNGNILLMDGPDTQCAQAGVSLPTLPGSVVRAFLVQ